jgi:hypothetical protein
MVQAIVEKIKNLFNEKNYVWYETPFKLNIVAVRSDNRISNSFDDYLYVIYKVDNNRWEIKQ